MNPLLVLDLDETLIHAEPGPRPVEPDFRVGPFDVLLRPFATEFLMTVADRYQLGVWTSATADYAAGITAELAVRSGVPFQFVWARDRCTRRVDPETGGEGWIKDLKKLRRAGYDLRRVLVVDDTAAKLARSYGNLVLVSPFLGDPGDDELRHLGPYLLRLASEPDYRRIEKRGWRRPFHRETGPLD